MTHDPLCGLAQPCDEEEPEHGYCSMQHGLYCIHCHQWCICNVIAKVCEDERDGIQAVRLRTLFNEQGYRDGQRDMLAKCITAVEEIIPDDSDNGSWEATIAAAWLRHAVSRIRQEKP